MTAPPPARKPGKLHVSLQNCANCAYSRPRGTGGNYGIECRWEGPPWTDKQVSTEAWCRRWAAIPPPPPKPDAKGS